MILHPARAFSALLLASLGLLAACGDAPEVTSSETEGQARKGLAPLVHADEDPGRPGFFDFGTVPHGETVRHTFLLENTEPRPLTIQQLHVGCVPN